LKGAVGTWLNEYEAHPKASQPPEVMDYDGVNQAFIDNFKKVEEPNKVWQSIQSFMQGED